MASFQTEEPAVRAIELLERIRGLYDTAIHHVGDEELSELQQLLDRVDALTHQLPASDRTGVSAELVREVTDSHGRLLSAMAAAHTKARESVRHSNQGRKALRGYGNRTTTTGSRLQSLT